MHIVIVGGGTAGWLAAFMLNKVQPSHKITVIESSKIGIVGAGEGSTGLLTSILDGNLFEVDFSILDFMRETGSTLKYGIKHKDWTGPGTDYFGPLGGSDTATSIKDYFFALQYLEGNTHTSANLGIMYDNDYSPYNGKTFIDSSFSFHFDAHKVGQFFAKRSNATTIDAVVKSVNRNEQGFITSLDLDNNTNIEGDFFIDATGFARVLTDSKWQSYSYNLPVNSAMPFLIPSKEKFEPWTTAWAQTAGWMWQIPTTERIGCGYVFDDRFTTPDKAQEEIETVLGHSIDPIRILKFDTGRLDKFWNKNCLAIGLSAAFAEPLEATSIHSTIVQLIKFVFDSITETPSYNHNESNVYQYNYDVGLMYDNFKDFLNLHYQGNRTDSEFWRYVSSGEIDTDAVKQIKDLCKYRMPTAKDFDYKFGFAGYDLWIYVLAGTNVLSKEVVKNSLILSADKIALWKDRLSTVQQNVHKTYEFNLRYQKFMQHVLNNNSI